MKRTQYSIEVAGIVFATREQADVLVKVIKQSLAMIDAKGGITKVVTELTPVRVNSGKRKRKALTPAPLPVASEGKTAQQEILPN